MTGSINSSTTPIAGGLAAGYTEGFFAFGAPEALVPLGSSQATAAPVIAQFSTVAGADGTLSIMLPAIQKAGDTRLVYSSTASNGLPIYPNTGATINGGSGDAAVTIEGKTLALFVATSLTNWSAIYTAN